MDCFTKKAAVEWIEHLDWMINEMNESDTGELSVVMDLLSEGKDELQSIMD